MNFSIHITEEKLQIIEDLSAAAFTISEMASVIQVDKKEFEILATTEKHPVYEAVERGKLKRDFSVSTQLRANAEAGNITAIQQLEKLIDRKETQNLKSRIFYGED